VHILHLFLDPPMKINNMLFSTNYLKEEKTHKLAAAILHVK
jgi:hypothetical protein